jgi:hypothetical protein
MSETDGARFYQHRNKPEYFWNPAEWQEKSNAEGFNWTLDSDLLIPVKVKDMDNQGQHDDNGVELTLGMAMLGNYQAYYYDEQHTKMYNKVSRSDMELSNKDIANFVKASFASAPVTYTHQQKDNPYDFTISHREQNGSATLDISKLFNLSEEEQSWVCDYCQGTQSSENDTTYDAYDNPVCEDCIENYFVHIKSVDKYYREDDQYLVYVESADTWFHQQHDTVIECTECSTSHAESGNGILQLLTVQSKFHKDQDNTMLCSDCFIAYANNNDLELGSCMACAKTLITSTGWESTYPKVKTIDINVINPDESTSHYVSFCDTCAPKFFVCPCGLIKDKTETQFGSCTPTPVASFDDSVALNVTSCCGTCLGNVTEDESGFMTANFEPIIPSFVKIVAKDKLYHNIDSINVQALGDDPF